MHSSPIVVPSTVLNRIEEATSHVAQDTGRHQIIEERLIYDLSEVMCMEVERLVYVVQPIKTNGILNADVVTPNWYITLRVPAGAFFVRQQEGPVFEYFKIGYDHTVTPFPDCSPVHLVNGSVRHSVILMEIVLHSTFPHCTV